jgi:hypothetical protein
VNSSKVPYSDKSAVDIAERRGAATRESRAPEAEPAATSYGLLKKLITHSSCLIFECGKVYF